MAFKKISVGFLMMGLMATAMGQTWKKQNSTTLPVVTENSTCNGVDQTTAISSDRKSLLTCQSGVWKKIEATGISCGISGMMPFNATTRGDIVNGNNGLTVNIPEGASLTLLQTPTATIGDLSGNPGPTYPMAATGGVYPQSYFALYSPWGSCPNNCVAVIVRRCEAGSMKLISNVIWSATYVNGFITLIQRY